MPGQSFFSSDASRFASQLSDFFCFPLAWVVADLEFEFPSLVDLLLDDLSGPLPGAGWGVLVGGAANLTAALLYRAPWAVNPLRSFDTVAGTKPNRSHANPL